VFDVIVGGLESVDVVVGSIERLVLMGSPEEVTFWNEQPFIEV